ncbi:MoaD/ThiS family protein [Gordonia westfalica]|uniref:MoaD/ThiS family protein n=1 Tax=Gordonia westfalica TaxID=158898 RepID=A0ABU2H0F9_9ACTN|nr:MoaD/ThiS family protein [Gordonia westfalica]MDS1116740.1 MoaD/ThiS family protein [Gordonia westfalica]
MADSGGQLIRGGLDSELCALRHLQVNYFAAAVDAAGCSYETIALPTGATIAEVRQELIARHGEKMATILGVAAYLVDDELTRDLSTVVSESVDIMPPFAGG